MMKRIGILVGILLLFALAGGGYYFAMKAEKSMLSGKTPTPTKSKETVFGSIQEALAKSLSLTCDYTYNTMHTVAYIKKGMVRADVVDTKDASLSGSVIMKDKKIYYWNAKKTGFMMALPEASSTSSAGSNTDQSGQNTLQNLEKFKQYCKTATVADNEFVIPTDVKFTDETQTLKVAPTGTNYQQQMQQYMQQYHISPTQ